MDLGCLVTKDKADEGVWFQVKLYGKDQPFEVKILGDDADAVIKFTRNRSREKLGKLKLDKIENYQSEIAKSFFDGVLDYSDENALVRLAGIRAMDKEPLMLGNVELKCDEASYKLVIEKIPALKEFIIAKSRERSNFFSS